MSADGIIIGRSRPEPEIEVRQSGPSTVLLWTITNEAPPQTDEMYGALAEGIEWGGSGWAKKLTNQFLSCGRTRLAFDPEGPEPTGAGDEHSTQRCARF